MSRISISVVDGLVADAVARRMADGSAPMDVLTYAADATRRAMALRGGAVTTGRVDRYFSAVVRRRLLRHCGGTSAAARIVAEAVVEDLRASGRDARAIADELERGWSSQLPTDIIDEWRSRLCA